MLTRGASMPCWARRLSRRALDVFLFGTAIAAAQYSDRLVRHSAHRDPPPFESGRPEFEQHLNEANYFQGGLWSNYDIDLATTSQTEGPMIAGTEVIGQKVLTHAFPLIEDIPVGAPGVPVVYAQPDAPTNYVPG